MTGDPNSNLDPESCKSENWSRDGNRDEISSASVSRLALVSRAAKGSPLVTLGACPAAGTAAFPATAADAVAAAAAAAGAEAVGRPLLMGTTSGILGLTSAGGEYTAPTAGPDSRLSAELVGFWGLLDDVEDRPA